MSKKKHSYAFTKKDIPQGQSREIIFDESAGSADELNRRVAELANDYGAHITMDQEGEDVSEMLSYAGDEALDYLNTLCSPDVYFDFDDNSLFLNLVGAKEEFA